MFATQTVLCVVLSGWGVGVVALQHGPFYVWSCLWGWGGGGNSNSSVE